MKFLSLLLLLSASSTYSYDILCVFPVPSHSHNTLGKGIVDALLKDGHSVTWVTPYPEKVGKNPPKTLQIIDVKEVQQFVQGVDMMDPMTLSRGLAYVKEFANNISRTVITSPSVMDVVIKKQFDAVVTEVFFSDIMAGFAAVQQAPWILLSGSTMMPPLQRQVDEIHSTSTVPVIFNEAGIPMNFKERAVNTLITVFMTIGNWVELPATRASYEKYFGPLARARNVPLPSFDEAHHNVSILLVNSHESISPTYSTPPNVINVAGYHIDENPPPLPKDLQDLLDKSTKGVVYFSMGSVLRSAALKPHTRKALLAKFAALPYTVLWKFEDKIEDLPPNVHVRPWMPQLSILVHPNVKAFITHGGLLSTLEAVRAGVPLLAVPVFGDQPANAASAARAGYALRVHFGPDMADELDEKLRELLGDPKYTDRVKYLSKLFRDRPVHPSKLVSHYVRLAIETKGAYHLRSLALQYSWVERWMLDLALLLVAILIVIVWFLSFIVRSFCRKVCGTSGKVEFSQSKKKDSKKKKN